MATKTYEVLVTSTWTFWETLYVDAETEDEARYLAQDEHHCEWSNSKCLGGSEVLEIRVVPSEDA